MRTDEETGEIENSVHLLLSDFDLETGESNTNTLNMNIIWRKRKGTFQVPKKCLEESKKKDNKRNNIFKNRTYSMADKNEVMNLKEVGVKNNIELDETIKAIHLIFRK